MGDARQASEPEAVNATGKDCEAGKAMFARDFPIHKLRFAVMGGLCKVYVS